MTSKSKLNLWPFFIVELLSLVAWAPIAALAGMGYTSSFSWGNVYLIIFHLYPVYIFLAAPIAFALKAFGKNNIAILFALLPPAISALGFASLFVYASYETPRQSGDERKQTKLAFKQKCNEAGESFFAHPTENIESIFIESQPPYSFSRINNGKYLAERPDGSYYGVVNSGYLKQYETAEENIPPSSKKPFRRYTYSDTFGSDVDTLQSRYGLRYLSKVNASEIKIGVVGGSLEVYRIEDNFVIARTTYFINSWEKEFCGTAPDGSFSSFDFARRALDLKSQYKSAYKVNEALKGAE